MNPKIRRILPIAAVVTLAVAAVAGYYLSRSAGKSGGVITASGSVEATEIAISPEISGRVVEVFAAKGDSVTAGEPLLRLDDTLLQAQRKQAEAALESAQAALDTANGALNIARLQYQQILENAQLAEPDILGASQPSEFDLPSGYFTKAELIAAAQAEVEAARQALEEAKQDLQTLLNDPEYAGVIAAEQRLARAQAAFLTAQDALNKVTAEGASQEVRDAAQEQYDAAKTELEDAQKAYDELLSADPGMELLKARARVQAAEERYHAALARLARLQTGEDSYPVQLAAAAVTQAENAVAQAQKAVNQAQAQLDLIDAQIGKLTAYAPIDGTIIERTIEPGEVALVGSTALVLGELDTITITVYIPENRYGEISLNQKVSITVDSYPGRTFTGTVVRIADRAEFTPRNVQTSEGRRTMVFAVEIKADNAGHELKPGMPADVKFEG